MKIVLLDCTRTKYNGHSLGKIPLGGIETCTALLAEAFVSQGHDVMVFTHSSEEFFGDFNGVCWRGFSSLEKSAELFQPDIVIANNDASLFDRAAQFFGRKFLPVLWMHNRMVLEKTIRKGRFFSLLKWRPVGVFLGEKHLAGCHFLHRFRRREIMPHGLPEHFIGYTKRDVIPAKEAIFFSQPYRGFKQIVDLWIGRIHGCAPDAVLRAFVGDADLKSLGIEYSKSALEKFGIILMPRVVHSELVSYLEKARVMVYLGHVDETFCCAASEASALGVPIVTYGIGALSERVEHGQSGFVAQNDEVAFSRHVIDILGNDDLWKKLSDHSIDTVQGLSWKDIAVLWEEKVFRASI